MSKWTRVDFKDYLDQLVKISKRKEVKQNVESMHIDGEFGSRSRGFLLFRGSRTQKWVSLVFQSQRSF